MAPDVKIIPTLPEHIATVAERMRKCDRDEIWAGTHNTPLDALTDSVEMSDKAMTWTWMMDGKPEAIGGVAAMDKLPKIGIPWLLATDQWTSDPFRVLAFSKDYVARMLTKYPTLFNYVDARNRPAVKWLKWCGFEIHPAVPFGLDKLPFHPFVKRK